MANEKKYKYFVGKDQYETDQQFINGAQIKARIPNLDPTLQLSLEGHGNDPDRIIADDESIDLDPKGQGIRRFTLVPPANFG